MNIGDIGKLEDGIFTLYTTLEQQGITLKVRESNSSLNLDYTSKDSVKVTNEIVTSVSAAGLPVAKGKLVCKIKFQENEGSYFRLPILKSLLLKI